MPSLHMGESVYRFEAEVVEKVTRPGVSGNYVFGERGESGDFYPKLIGRSDTDVQTELRNRLGTVGYGFFMVSAASPRVAYDRECAQFHTFKNQLDNKTHPAPPAGSRATCFLCGL